MVIKPGRRYALTKPHKEAIEAWLNEEISTTEAAAAVGLTIDNFKAMVGTMLKHMVSDGSVDITRALKNY